ncbi:uncharacterized protein LOC143543113 [Bidens hawaiensis]|uniref:uncharacterized protein LOC143543113 n=1 Tax=Bidens hawaiensis TaxID=980011 RepID=UPI00404A0504
MAANLIPIQPHSVIRASATTSDHRKNSESNTKNWWTPLFDWSSEPDYIGPTSGKIHTTTNKNNNISSTDFTTRSNRSLVSESESEQRSVRSRGVSSVKFTDEKAKKLRMLTSETESFHDAMYHSAIASRFASDFSDRFG